MKIKQKLIIMSSMLCIVLSLVAVCFSIAWYAMYPIYTNLDLVIGDSALTISNQIFLRSKEATTNKPSWGGTMGKDYNVKIHSETVFDKDKSDIVNGNQDSAPTVIKDKTKGSIEINFPDLSYNFLNMNDPTGGIIDQNGGLLDKDTMSIDIRYFTFAMIELTMHNGFFSNYLYADLRLDMTATSSDTTIDLTPYASTLIKIRTIDDVNMDHPSDAQQLHIVGKEPDFATNVATLENFTTPTEQITFKTPYPLFDGYVGTQGSTPYQVLIDPNPYRNPKVENLNFYSYAYAFSLSFDPIQFMDFYTKYNHTDTKINLALVLNFHASGNELAGVEEGAIDVYE